MADAFSRLRTDGEDTTHLDDNLPVCNVEKIQVTNSETSYEQVCTECDVEKDMITGKPNEDLINKTEKRVSTVQPTDRSITKRKVPIIETFTVDQAMDSNCCDDATHVESSGSEHHIDHSKLLARALKIDGCPQKVFPVSPQSAFSMRSIIHQLPDTRMSNACTTECKMNS